jgi:hypothetical protein
MMQVRAAHRITVRRSFSRLLRSFCARSSTSLSNLIRCSCIVRKWFICLSSACLSRNSCSFSACRSFFSWMLSSTGCFCTPAATSLKTPLSA